MGNLLKKRGVVLGQGGAPPEILIQASEEAQALYSAGRFKTALKVRDPREIEVAATQEVALRGELVAWLASEKLDSRGDQVSQEDVYDTCNM